MIKSPFFNDITVQEVTSFWWENSPKISSLIVVGIRWFVSSENINTFDKIAYSFNFKALQIL